MMNLHCSLLVPLAVTLFIFSEIPVTSANKTVPCDKTGCRVHEFCNLSTGKCTPYNGECRTEPCKPGYYCNDYGKCINDTCDMECPSGKECYLMQVQCIRAPCPRIPSCRLNKCATVKCGFGETCEDGVCVDSSCALILCLKGTICYKGACYAGIDCEGQCGPVEKCYARSEACSKPPCPRKVICKPDKCAVVRCSSGHKCIDGHCVLTDDCL